MIDTHCHLDFKDFKGDLDGVLERARNAGVCKMITVGIDVPSSLASVSLAEKYEQVFASVGIHPNSTSNVSEGDWRRLESLAERPGVVAVGETGLDYYRDSSPPEMQKAAFRRQIEIASQKRLPLIIHCRQAYDDCYDILRQLERPVAGVMHCFSGSAADAERFAALGLHISFAGPVTFPRAEDLRDVARTVRPEILLLETDAPFLAPQPQRGRRNEPAFVAHTAAALAELYGLSRADIERVSTLNANRLFGLAPLPNKPALAYMIRDSLYINLTAKCSNKCGFCIKNRTPFVMGHYLALDGEPAVEDIIEEIGTHSGYDEAVFCGLGEPTYRLEEIKKIAARLKSHCPRVRLNTNGQGDLINGREICPEMAGLVDAVSISLNQPDAKAYDDMCRSMYGEAAFGAVVDFARSAARYIPEVTLTAPAMPGVDIDGCRKLARELGVKFRVRRYSEVE